MADDQDGRKVWGRGRIQERAQKIRERRAAQPPPAPADPDEGDGNE